MSTAVRAQEEQLTFAERMRRRQEQLMREDDEAKLPPMEKTFIDIIQRYVDETRNKSGVSYVYKSLTVDRKDMETLNERQIALLKERLETKYGLTVTRSELTDTRFEPSYNWQWDITWRDD